MNSTHTILCVASYFKGIDFIRACKASGWRVLLLTSEEFRDAEWPREDIDQILLVPQDKDAWDMEFVMKGISGLLKKEKIDKIAALDDFDVERAARIREQFRIPGMGDTRARYFRDKLAMRMMADDTQVPNPAFVAPFNDEAVNDFIARIPAPWILKPRSQASAHGIKKFHDADTLWKRLNELGDDRSRFVLEQFIPGDVYHIDAITYEGKVTFVRVSKYMSPPFEVSHEGGVFRTYTLDNNDPIAKDLIKHNEGVIKGFGMKSGATHTEFLRAHEDGKYYFIETASRVGGANIAEMVEAASGINLWAEWAKIETLAPGKKYKAPKGEGAYAGIIISLAQQEWPDMTSYNDPEIVWKMNKKQHAGIIVKASSPERVVELLDNYAKRFYQDFFMSMPAPDKQ